jgi:hypothetical protein
VYGRLEESLAALQREARERVRKRREKAGAESHSAAPLQGPGKSMATQAEEEWQSFGGLDHHNQRRNREIRRDPYGTVEIERY